MTFPRTLADGRICCSREDALCDTCRAHYDRANLGLRTVAERKTPSEWRDHFGKKLGVGSIQPDPPLDGYAIALGARPPVRQTNLIYDANGIPDPYAAGVAAMRRNNR